MLEKSSTSWFWALVPIQAAIGALTVLLPLYVLQLGGSVIDIGNIAAVGNLALIPGSLTWGRVADFYGVRRTILIASFSGLSIVFVIMYLTNTLIAILVLYAVFAFLTAAIVPIVNLLLMETFPKQMWSRMFARASSFITTGLMLGTLPGIFWTTRLGLPLRSYLILCIALSIPAVILAIKLVPEPRITFERGIIPTSPLSVLLRLLSVPLIFVKIPSASDFRSFWKLIRGGLNKELPLLYAVMFLFFTSGSMVFTQYPALLKQRGLSEDEVFLSFFYLFLVNAVSFLIAGKISQAAKETTVSTVAMSLRIAGILSASAVSYLTGGPLLLATFAIFTILSISFTFSNTANSSLLFKALGVEKQGELLGVYSAFTGVGLFLGSLASGYVSFTLGFAANFLFASFLVMIGLFAFSRFARTVISS